MVRWTQSRKAELVAAIAAGAISAEEAQALHALSAEELTTWQRAVETGGQGLRCRDQGRRNRDRLARFQASIA